MTKKMMCNGSFLSLVCNNHIFLNMWWEILVLREHLLVKNSFFFYFLYISPQHLSYVTLQRFHHCTKCTKNKSLFVCRNGLFYMHDCFTTQTCQHSTTQSPKLVIYFLKCSYGVHVDSTLKWKTSNWCFFNLNSFIPLKTSNDILC